MSETDEMSETRAASETRAGRSDADAARESPRPFAAPKRAGAVRPLRVAVAGATGAVGREMLEILSERSFPVSEVALLASARSAGERVTALGAERVVRDLDSFDFGGWDLGLFSPGGAVSAAHAPRAAAAGVLVVDNTSHFRMEPDVPLVVPEVNGGALAARPPRGIVSNPNCSTIQLVVALAPLGRLAPLRRVVADTYQAAGGAGRAAMEELFEQTRGLFTGEEVSPSRFPTTLAFNVIPHVDALEPDGGTREERKMREETRKIMAAPDLRVQVTCVRVPVMVGHAVAAHAEFSEEVSVESAHAALGSAEGVALCDRAPGAPDGGAPGSLSWPYMTPRDSAGRDSVYVSRLRRDASVPHGLSLWIVADNLRKGAALNAVQIAEELARRGHFNR